MDTDRKLGEVAAKLDDMSDSIEELKDAAHEADSPREDALDDLQQDVEDASPRSTQSLTRNGRTNPESGRRGAHPRSTDDDLRFEPTRGRPPADDGVARTASARWNCHGPSTGSSSAVSPHPHCRRRIYLHCVDERRRAEDEALDAIEDEERR